MMALAFADPDNEETAVSVRKRARHLGQSLRIRKVQLEVVAVTLGLAGVSEQSHSLE
jgi:hypothetical protein